MFSTSFIIRSPYPHKKYQKIIVIPAIFDNNKKIIGGLK